MSTKLKEKILRILGKNKGLRRIVYKIYYRLKYKNEFSKNIGYGSDNADRLFYVIRPAPTDAWGLMGLLYFILRRIEYAEQKKYIPWVDLKNFRTQYTNEKYFGRENVWEYYFEQVSPYLEEEIHRSKNVILSGIYDRADHTIFKISYDEEALKQQYAFISKHIHFKPAVNDLVVSELKNISLEKTVGVYLRGTDYTSIKPSKHYVQPSLADVNAKIEEYAKKHRLQHVYLVTEDASIYKTMMDTWGDMIKIVSFDSFVSNYKGKSVLNKSNFGTDDGYTRGLHYLVKMIVLSKCHYLITSITYGSWMAMAFNGATYIDKYVFDLGTYQ